MRTSTGTPSTDDGTPSVLDADEPAALWVGDPNPRAQAFYRRTGFVEDGVSTVEDGVRSVRMLRPARRVDHMRP